MRCTKQYILDKNIIVNKQFIASYIKAKYRHCDIAFKNHHIYVLNSENQILKIKYYIVFDLLILKYNNYYEYITLENKTLTYNIVLTMNNIDMIHSFFLKNLSSKLTINTYNTILDKKRNNHWKNLYKLLIINILLVCSIMIYSNIDYFMFYIIVFVALFIGSMFILKGD